MSDQEKNEEEVVQWVEAITDDPEQLREGWAALDPQGQIELLQKIALPQELITQYWSTIGDKSDYDQFRFLCCKHQELSPEFLKEHWDTFGIDAKYACLLSQTSVPRELVDSFWEGLRGQLPEQQIDSEDMVRAFAKNVPPKHQPEGFESSEEDSSEEA